MINIIKQFKLIELNYKFIKFLEKLADIERLNAELRSMERDRDEAMERNKEMERRLTEEQQTHKKETEKAKSE